MTYKVVLTGENWHAVFDIEAQDAEAAIHAVRDISMYDRDAVTIAEVAACLDMEGQE